MRRYVYLFKEGSALLKRSLGLKGARLCEMYRMGLPVPPGLVINVEACEAYYKNGCKDVPGLQSELQEAFGDLEKELGQKFGGEQNPLILSVRPGAEVQMPGIIKSYCNVGLNDKSVKGLEKISDARFAWSTYRAFLESFASDAMGVPHAEFAVVQKSIMGGRSETSVEDIRNVVNSYLKLILKTTGREFPQDPEEQLRLAISSLHRAWGGRQAATYRRLNDLTDLKGCGVTIQKMVFGNLNAKSGSGRVFTRSPITGRKEPYGEYSTNSQGEELSKGLLVPSNIDGLKAEMPEVYNQLGQMRERLESHFRSVQDFQFTIENGRLFLLHSKNAKLGAGAEVRTAVDLVTEHVSDEMQVLRGFDAPVLNYLQYRTVDPATKQGHKFIGKGIPGSQPSAIGCAVFDPARVEEYKQRGKGVILFSRLADIKDYATLLLADGFVFQRGGATADLSILLRDKGKACVLSCSELEIGGDGRTCTIGTHTLREGDTVTVQGNTGEVFEGEVPLVDVEPGAEYEQLMIWADSHKKMRVMANASRPEEVLLAKKYGAEGIGLYKTEFMFNDPARIQHIQRAILADTVDGRRRELDELVLYHKDEFKTIMKTMNGLPCIFRILDPPLNTFVPEDRAGQERLASELHVPVDVIAKKQQMLAEYNPTLGLRGSRLAVMYPEIVEFQAKAVLSAALEAVEEGMQPFPCFECPMISSVKELELVKNVIREVARETGAADKIRYKVGLLIEIPRAALTADELAKEADFMHFASNDLTQLTCGFSRADSEKFIDTYVDLGAYRKNPFQTIDLKGVGELMRIGTQKARKAKKSTRLGASGSHASDPLSIQYCQYLGLDEISCPASKIPVAKIAAAQAALKFNS